MRKARAENLLRIVENYREQLALVRAGHPPRDIMIRVYQMKLDASDPAEFVEFLEERLAHWTAAYMRALDQ